MTGHAVVIAGGGPTGLMLAGDLALAGVDVAIVERRASQDLPSSRAGGPHSRTIEALDQRVIAQDDTGVDVEVSDDQARGRNISSGATEDAVSSVKQPASSSPGGIRQRAA